MKRAAAAVAAACAAFSAGAVFERATPESQGVPSAAIERFVDACDRELDVMHSFVVLRHGKRIAEGWWHPFDVHLPQHVFSHSKSFTSTAAGLLRDEGKLGLDERVADIFPEKLPPSPCDEAKSVRVRDLLTMNAGQDAEAIFVEPEGDWVKAFLANRFVRKPGTGFRYDSCASHVLAAIVERKSGMKLMDYLETKLFSKIGISGAWSEDGPDGAACGGWGMRFKTHDLARLGQLYLQDGEWEGAQIISRDWVRQATSAQTKTDRPGDGDWSQGYGFQFWRCRHGCYRADGASGQYTVVMPEQDAVVSMTAGLPDMAKQLDLVWKHLLPAMGPEPLPENDAAYASLERKCATLCIAPWEAGARGRPGRLGVAYSLDGPQNRFQISSVSLERRGKGWTLVFMDECGRQELPVGRGEWWRGSVRLERDTFGRIDGLSGEQPTAASGGWMDEDTFEARAYLTGTPSWMHFKLEYKPDGTLAFAYKLWGWGGGETNLKGTKWPGTAQDAEGGKEKDK